MGCYWINLPQPLSGRPPGGIYTHEYDMVRDGDVRVLV